MNTAFTLSMDSTCSIEEVAEGSPHGVRFIQMYVFPDRDLTVQLIQRAEQNGYKGILLTVDAPCYGKRLADHYNSFSLPPHFKYVILRTFSYNPTRKP